MSKSTEELKDTDLMPWGKFKGVAMINVPSWYLLWLHKENKCSGVVKKYIEQNFNVLIKENEQIKTTPKKA